MSDNQSLPPVDMSTYRALGDSTTSAPIKSTSSLPPVDLSTYRPLGGATPVKTAAPPAGILDKDIPLTSYGNATLSGLQSIGRGVRSAVTGVADTFSAPKDDTEKTISAISPIALPLYRTLRGAGHSVKDAAQITGAIHDINNSADPLGTYAKAAQETAGEGAGQALTALAAEGIIKAVPRVSEVTGAAYKNTKGLISTKTLQEPLQAGVQNVVKNAARDAGMDTDTLTSKSIRKVAEDAGDGVQAKAKADYQALDQAVGDTRFQSFRDKLEAGRRQLRDLTGTEEDVAKEAKLLKAQKEIEDAQQAAFAEAKAKGVDPNLIDRADANWKKSQALYDVDNAIKKSTTGAHPDVSTPELNEEYPETVDPRKLHNRVTNLYDSGRLQDALGEKGANDLFDHTLEHSGAYQKILRNQKIALYGTPVAASVLGIGGLVKHLMHLGVE